jgi:hypothetical protein
MKILLLQILLLSSVAFAQNKKEYYLDENWTQLSKKDFIKKIDHSINIAHNVENDTAIFRKLYVRKNYGMLSQLKADSIREYISELMGHPVDKQKVLVINYYSGLDQYIAPPAISRWNIYDRDYLKKLHKIANIEQLYVYKYPENLRYHNDKRINWHFDKEALIENTFFPYHFNYGSFVIIHPNNNYSLYYGEYGKDTVWEMVEEMVKKYGDKN